MIAMNSDLPEKPKRVIVCLGRSCRKDNSAQVFTDFQAHLPPDVELISVMCLGQCGNGSMVVVEPGEIWYSQIQPQEVATIVQQHLIGNSPVQAMLYPKFS